ncbi:MAG: bifunctional riboflavin kinase/FAD synthetase [Anaerolineae bacterium]|nr:bifunctional riboflavin kinase/FAD synthetase [Anaerolineae bacterium]
MTERFQRVDSLEEITGRRPTYLAIGVFDGVHRGHQHLLERMVAAAREAGATPAVLTFFPHPLAVIRGLEGRIYLTDLERRLELLAAPGIELAIVHPFNDDVRRTRAKTFIDRLCAAMDLRQLWGGSFSLGYQREGTVEYLRDLGSERGFTVQLINDLVTWKGDEVSSSRIRRALAEGDIEEVNGCLGRLFEIEGTVIKGDRRGHLLGFPTANLAVWEQQLLPANGVYAAYAYLDGVRYGAATNVGVRPTVNGANMSVEAHLLDFDREIYGERLSLAFVHRIREERKFSDLEALKQQISADVEAIRALL